MIRTHQTVVVICILFSGISAEVNVSVSYESDTEPDVYRDEPLKLMCKADGVTADDSFRLRINILKSGVDDTSISCQADSEGRGERNVEEGDLKALLIQVPTDGECALLPEESMSVTMNLTSELSDYQIRCDFYNSILGAGNGDFASELQIPQINVAPQGLTMSISPEPVQEGEAFEAVCRSNRASPSSSYKYDILHDGMPIGENQDHGRYTPTKDDRLGFSVRCTDTVHPNWRNQADIIATSQTMYAQFIDIGDDASDKQEKVLNPTYTNTLVCDLIAHNEAEITYSWVAATVKENNASTRALTLDARQPMTDEEITCKGTVGNLSKIMAWNITWDIHATTTIGNKATQLTTTAGLYRGAIVMMIIMVQA